jgi:hypothetical protein
MPRLISKPSLKDRHRFTWIIDDNSKARLRKLTEHFGHDTSIAHILRYAVQRLAEQEGITVKDVIPPGIPDGRARDGFRDRLNS